MNEKSSFSIGLLLKGAAMGIAEVIPGVSGGTIAFITGIYERLINCIKSFDAKAVKLLLSFKLRELFLHVDGMFLLILFAGMVCGIGVGVFGVGYLLEFFPAPLWAFFFGLIVASALYIGRQITKWTAVQMVSMLIGFAIALGVTYFSPAEGSESLLWVFTCGVIAISALILPGVSGSFILLMLGMYTVVRGAAEDAMRNQELSSLLILVAFVLGCGVGLLSFARVMSYAFKHYKNATLALLTGFMIGSLRKIWPWRNIDTVLDKETGEVTRYQEMMYESMDNLQVLRELNVLPQDYQGNAQSVLVVIAAVVGFGVIFLFQYIARESK